MTCTDWRIHYSLLDMEPPLKILLRRRILSKRHAKSNDVGHKIKIEGNQTKLNWQFRLQDLMSFFFTKWNIKAFDIHIVDSLSICPSLPSLVVRTQLDKFLQQGRVSPLTLPHFSASNGNKRFEFSNLVFEKVSFVKKDFMKCRINIVFHAKMKNSNQFLFRRLTFSVSRLL